MTDGAKWRNCERLSTRFSAPPGNDLPCQACEVDQRRACRIDYAEKSAADREAKQKTAVDQILEERKRQHALWGEQNHDAGTWALILLEEIGEWAKAELHNRYGGPDAGLRHVEAVHMAAVAVQIVECLNRGKPGIMYTEELHEEPIGTPVVPLPPARPPL